MEWCRWAGTQCSSGWAPRQRMKLKQPPAAKRVQRCSAVTAAHLRCQQHGTVAWPATKLFAHQLTGRGQEEQGDISGQPATMRRTPTCDASGGSFSGASAAGGGGGPTAWQRQRAGRTAESWSARSRHRRSVEAHSHPAAHARNNAGAFDCRHCHTHAPTGSPPHISCRAPTSIH